MYSSIPRKCIYPINGIIVTYIEGNLVDLNTIRFCGHQLERSRKFDVIINKVTSTRDDVLSIMTQGEKYEILYSVEPSSLCEIPYECEVTNFMYLQKGIPAQVYRCIVGLICAEN